MNFLAHIYLSGSREDLLIGNFMGDYVKGSDYRKYPKGIQEGILLHRKIDYYTDSHPVTRLSREHVSQHYHKYSGIVIDIFYDYFLASNWDQYSSIPLPDFVDSVFELLKKYHEILPQGIKNWFPNFIRNNWLIAYSTIEGIEMVLHRMSSRTSLPEKTESGIHILRSKHKELLDEFNLFFPDIRDYVNREFGVITGCDFGMTGT
jgi:acyl carrier protein phosphodiesterase